MNHLYLHVPFCNNICFYCDFKRSVYQTNWVDKWLKRIQEDIQAMGERAALDTIYIGGGTPTCLSLPQLEELLDAIHPFAKQVKEYTIESNVESITPSMVALLKQYGINRISIGVQSFQPSLLKEMNRQHTTEEIQKAMQIVVDGGIHNISIDLIYGFASQTMSMWKQDLQQAIALPHVTHISLYSLTIEENSVFGKQGKDTCEPMLEAKMYEEAIAFLNANGFCQYEVANFAKENKQSQHNIGYWMYDDFYGIGVGASGKENHKRYTIEGSIEQYCKKEEEIETVSLTHEEEMFEQIMMSLRMCKGIDETIFQERYGVSIWDVFSQAIEEGLDANDLEYKKPYIACTTEGMFHLHDVLLRFMR